MKAKFKKGDLVRVSRNRSSDTVYRVSWIDGFNCQIEERKADGTFYSPQNFDTDLLEAYVEPPSADRVADPAWIAKALGLACVAFLVFASASADAQVITSCRTTGNVVSCSTRSPGQMTEWARRSGGGFNGGNRWDTEGGRDAMGAPLGSGFYSRGRTR